MSYDPAVWEGERPPSDKAAGEVFGALYERYLESDGHTGNHPRSGSDEVPVWATMVHRPVQGNPGRSVSAGRHRCYGVHEGALRGDRAELIP